MRVKKSVISVIEIDSVFLIFIALSAALKPSFPIASQIIYYFAFVASLGLFLFLARGREQPSPLPKVVPDREGALLTLPLISPALISVMGISFLTSYLLSLAGKTGATVLQGDFLSLFLLHALVPAALEELVFRYVPMTLIAPHSKKSAVVISALLFAFVHCDLFEIPYALFAGFLYIILDIACDSVLPSIILHLVNNTVAIIWQTALVPSGNASAAIYVILGITAVSAAVIVILRRRYLKRLSGVFQRSDRAEVPILCVAFIAATAALAIISLF